VTSVRFRKLAVFGVGLIGGSFGLALKDARLVGKVAGIGRSRANLNRALEMGAIDEVAEQPALALADADLVLVAVPVQQMQAVFGAIAAHLAPDAVVTDAGSTKRDVIEAARVSLGNAFARFVPAHPIAGAERSGAEAASRDLYRNRTVVITPQAETDPQARARVEAAWSSCGARLVEMTAPHHDEVLAAISHLPHALAFALVDMIARRPDATELFAVAGAGFRDFTRIASSSPEMWRDICIANRDLVLRELRAFQSSLTALAGLLEHGDAAALERVFESARTARNAWLQNRG